MSDLLKYMAENLTEKDMENIRLSAQLLPCPFCGTEPIVEEIKPHRHMFCGLPDYEGSVYAECVNCDIHMTRRTAEELKEAWNRRTK